MEERWYKSEQQFRPNMDEVLGKDFFSYEDLIEDKMGHTLAPVGIRLPDTDDFISRLYEIVRALSTDRKEVASPIQGDKVIVFSLSYKMNFIVIERASTQEIVILTTPIGADILLREYEEKPRTKLII